MIGPTGSVRVMVATKPVDFRKGAERLTYGAIITVHTDTDEARRAGSNGRRSATASCD